MDVRRLMGRLERFAHVRLEIILVNATHEIEALAQLPRELRERPDRRAMAVVRVAISRAWRRKASGPAGHRQLRSEVEEVRRGKDTRIVDVDELMGLGQVP